MFKTRASFFSKSRKLFFFNFQFSKISAARIRRRRTFIEIEIISFEEENTKHFNFDDERSCLQNL